MKLSLGSILVAAALSSAPAVAHAYSEGITGRAASGCLGIIPTCHNDTMGRRDGAMVTIDGPMTVEAGSRTTYTVRVSRTDMGTLAGAGLNVIASGGALRTSAPATRIAGCELTHSALIAPAMAGATEVRIPFDFIAPASSTTVTLQAAANGVDGNGTIPRMPGQTGDQWGTASFSVMVTGVADGGVGGVCPEPVDVVANDAADASDAPTDSATPPPDANETDARDASVSDVGSESGPPRVGCACRANVGANRARSSLAIALASLAVATVIARRRRASRVDLRG
ncbi:MAG: hypothetical protein JNK05_17590 [Myxococcales bacterium]|nr:hypothetical protein [Myxococcales bacterium]